ncbi:MAG: hypothetical protein GYA35_10310 [Thermoanaerobaculaceae bacterium]|nr:hypothetical protein [Thermoanaerobaculaceae bacterium]
MKKLIASNWLKIVLVISSFSIAVLSYVGYAFSPFGPTCASLGNLFLFCHHLVEIKSDDLSWQVAFVYMLGTSLLLIATGLPFTLKVPRDEQKSLKTFFIDCSFILITPVAYSLGLWFLAPALLLAILFLCSLFIRHEKLFNVLRVISRTYSALIYIAYAIALLLWPIMRPEDMP